MSAIAEFLHMGGHGPYVWSAWILAALALAANAIAAAKEKRRALKDARESQNNGENSPA